MQFVLRNFKRVAAAVTVAALLLVGVGYAAYAQAGTTTDNSADTSTAAVTTPHDAVQAAIADALGLTVDELEDQLWAGRTLADLAEQAGVEIADLRAAAESAQQEYQVAQIQAAVEAGDITQEQADWMIEGINQGYWAGGWGRGSGFGMHHQGMMGGRGFGHHGWGGTGMGMGYGYGPGMGYGECDGECDGYGPGTGMHDGMMYGGMMYGGRGAGRPTATPQSND